MICVPSVWRVLILTIDLAELTKQVEDIITYSQVYDFNIDCSEMIRIWYANKKKFLDAFNGPIYFSDTQIEIDLSEEEKDKQFKIFMQQLEERADKPCPEYDEITFGEWLSQNRSEFFENRTSSVVINTDMKMGSKLLKNFKYFFSKDELREVQDLASQFIQRNKIKGYLYLSVHPVSFLTISENRSNWRSCHALDGEFRSGNLSYLQDDVTIVAGLCSLEQKKLRCMPQGMSWYDNKWRMLIHFTNNGKFCYFNKQYPFYSERIKDYVTYLINEALKSSFTVPSSYRSFRSVKTGKNNYTLPTNHFIIMGKVYDSLDVIHDGTRKEIFYNDLVHSHNYLPEVAFDKKAIQNPEYPYYTIYEVGEYADNPDFMKADMEIVIGLHPKCCKCGEDYLSYSDSFVCEYCEEKGFYSQARKCSYCGHIIYDDEKSYEHDTEIVCGNCHKEILRRQENDE